MFNFVTMRCLMLFNFVLIVVNSLPTENPSNEIPSNIETVVEEATKSFEHIKQYLKHEIEVSTFIINTHYDKIVANIVKNRADLLSRSAQEGEQNPSKKTLISYCQSEEKASLNQININYYFNSWKNYALGYLDEIKMDINNMEEFKKRLNEALPSCVSKNGNFNKDVQRCIRDVIKDILKNHEEMFDDILKKIRKFDGVVMKSIDGDASQLKKDFAKIEKLFLDCVNNALHQ